MTERQPFIAGNWKMHKTLAEARALARDIRDGAAPGRRAEVALAPPYTALAAVAAGVGRVRHPPGRPGHLLGESRAPIRAPSPPPCWPMRAATTSSSGIPSGASTSATPTQIVNRKLTAVIAAGLIPILCVGETQAERAADQTLQVVRRQIEGGLGALQPTTGTGLVVAYEPVWAIGTGLTATPEQAQTVHHFIRSLLREFLGPVAEAIRIQYGGSVTPDNAATLLAQPDIDGALVGGASLKPELFLPIIKAAG